jgi:hypothetical protein
VAQQTEKIVMSVWDLIYYGFEYQRVILLTREVMFAGSKESNIFVEYWCQIKSCDVQRRLRVRVAKRQKRISSDIGIWFEWDFIRRIPKMNVFNSIRYRNLTIFSNINLFQEIQYSLVCKNIQNYYWVNVFSFV